MILLTKDIHIYVAKLTKLAWINTFIAKYNEKKL